MSKNPTGPALAVLENLYRSMYMSRAMDRIEASYTGRGEASFTISGAGHEATAALAPHLIAEDYLACHYRDKALMIARGMTASDFFLSLFAKDGSFSRGRQMHGLISHAPGHILSLATPVGNNALHAVGIAAAIKNSPGKPLALVSLGDGTTQQGEVTEAVAHAVRDHLPVLFLIADNEFAISTKTPGRTFFSLPSGPAETYYGLPLTRANGRKADEAYALFAAETAHIRENRGPRILILEVERLASHSNADDQRIYRGPEEIGLAHEKGDPNAYLRALLIERGGDEKTVKKIETDVEAELEKAAEAAQKSENPRAVFTSVKPYEGRLLDPKSEDRGQGPRGDAAGLTMLESIREVLRHRLELDPRVSLFGQDLEDPKGDVFGVTRGLSSSFPGRVVNSPLAESTILGVAIGRALAGERPVAFLQFGDFLPVAYNQIFSELASMYWRTDGSHDAPVIVMVTCGGYRPGLGPYHASSLEALLAHTPGLDVFMPSTAGDAAGLLNAAFESGRPTVFLYPKNCLNDRENATSSKPDSLLVPPGRARFVRRGEALTFVGYGNTVRLCLQAAAALEAAGAPADVIDLRSIMPWDKAAVLESARRTGRLVVVHEDSMSCGMAAEVAAVVAEEAGPSVAIRRVTRADTWVPYNFENQLEVLPSYKRILETAVELLGGEISWQAEVAEEKGIFLVEAIGSSPSDESITVITWKTAAGDTVSSGQLLAEMEADKAAVDLNSPVSGVVESLLIEEGETVKVGTPIMKIRTAGAEEHVKTVLKEDAGRPLISGLTARRPPETPRAAPAAANRASALLEKSSVPVGIAGVAGALGSRRVTNEDIAELCPSWKPDDILKRTGIASRPWVGAGETALSLAMDACGKLFIRTGLRTADIDMILCATGTPMSNTPSMAALIHNELAAGNEDFLAPAYDINAACSGYIYGLQIAYDYLQSRPEAKILFVTTEVLSPRTDTADPITAPIFADAATASLLVAGDNLKGVGNRVLRPVLAAKGESGEYLRIPTDPAEKIFMEGQKVFLEAIRGMMLMLERACDEAGLDPAALDLIVPHQANQRIINAVRRKLRLPEERVFSNIRDLGNSSSSTIPLCLETILREKRAGEKLGLTAFGGGFTFGGGVIELV